MPLDQRTFLIVIAHVDSAADSRADRLCFVVAADHTAASPSLSTAALVVTCDCRHTRLEPMYVVPGTR